MMNHTETAMLRLDRLLVSRGLAGRKEAQKWVRRGYVEYQGEVLRDPSIKVQVDACLIVNGLISEPLPQLIAYHKPLHQLCTLRDPWGRNGLDYALPTHWREAFHPVGRLDAETSGLLLFSSAGSLTQYLLHPKRSLTRRYRAVVAGLPHNLEEKLKNGVETSLGSFTAVLHDQVAYDPSAHRTYLEDYAEVEQQAQGVVWLSVTEGKHRMVRRMLHNTGASVLALHRECYGVVELNDLAQGEFKVIDESLLAQIVS